MKRFGGKSEYHELEQELRRRRPEAPNQLVRSLSSELAPRPAFARLAGVRVAFAAAISLLVLAAFGASGGFGYASNAASEQITAFANLASEKKSSNGNGNPSSNARPADDQYRPGKGCGDKNHVHERENECKKLK
jgi:hypothetical protein